MAGRVLADLGADVVLVEPPGGHPLRRRASPMGGVVGGQAGDRGRPAPTIRDSTRCSPTRMRCIDTPGFPEVLGVDPGRAPSAVWVSVTPFGLTGTAASWRASDLGVLAASGNMYPTGDPDRPPVRCTEPSGYAHTGGEAAFAVLTALWTGRPQHGRPLDAGVRRRREHGVAGALRADRVPGPSARRAHRPHAARSGRRPTGSSRSGCAAARRASPRSRSSRRRSPTDGIDASALEAQDWSDVVRPTTRPRTCCAPSRSPSASTSPGTRCTSSTTSRARRTSCSPPRTHHGRSSSSASSTRAGSSRRSARSSSSRVAFVQVRSDDGEAAPVRPRLPRRRCPRRRRVLLAPASTGR